MKRLLTVSMACLALWGSALANWRRAAAVGAVAGFTAGEAPEVDLREEMSAADTVAAGSPRPDARQR